MKDVLNISNLFTDFVSIITTVSYISAEQNYMIFVSKSTKMYRFLSSHIQCFSNKPVKILNLFYN